MAQSDSRATTAEQVRLLAICKTATLVSIDLEGKLDSGAAVAAFVGAIAIFATGTGDADRSIAAAIAGLEEARRVYASKVESRVKDAS